jgi:hypothetical protein
LKDCQARGSGGFAISISSGGSGAKKPGRRALRPNFTTSRKQQVLEGKKLPEMFRKPSVKFNQLADEALAYSKRNKRSITIGL